MGTVTTLRPSATSSSTGWNVTGAATPHAATSDDSDASYVTWSGTGTALVMQTPLDSPPAGERRHQVRIRLRGEDGDVWWAVRLQVGALTAGASAQLTASPATAIGSWGFGAPPDAGTILAAHIEGQSTGVRVTEIYLDVDSREAPTFTPQVLDGSGASVTDVTDTATPMLHANAVDTDDLNLRQYRYWVTQGATIVWDTGIVSGPATDTMTSPLANGSYTAHMMIWTTLGASTEYASDEETLSFDVSVGEVAIPVDPVVTQTEGTPFWEIEVCAPDVLDFDDAVGYVEIERVDCAESEDPTPVMIARLGPLATDECASFTDYSFPRTGLGGSCTVDPESCCSYYRVRTIGRIDGSIVISAWSDVTDSGIPRGLIFMWPGTDASIPAGWDRVTELDGIYPKGIATASTQPGATGGSVSHSHTLGGHTHNLDHSHTVTGATSAGSGAISSTPGTAGTTAIATTHTHTRPAVGSTAVNSASTAPVTTSVNNDLERLAVIFIESDGSPAGIPANALGLTDTTSITGWTDYSDATGRYLKGAAAAGNGGATSASTLNNHTHDISAHIHGSSSHVHTSANTGTVASNLTLNAGPNAALWQTSHSHTITVGSNTTAALASASGGTSGATSGGTDEPPFRNTRIKQNTSGLPDLPVGIIGAWRGSLGSIPDNWALCDGTNGTPDLTGVYPKGAISSIGTTGGSLAAHTHTSPTHTHTTSGHTHTETIASAAATTANVSATATVSVSLGTHTHTGSATDSTTPTVGASTSGTLDGSFAEPSHEEVAFVQLVEPFTPEPDPTTYCLTWSDDEHLLRTTGPDGALWAPVSGMFSWDRDRPFTASMGVEGTRFITSAAPGERNLEMTAAVESEEDLRTLLAVLERPLVLISPSDSTEVWGAPVSGSVQVYRIGRIRQVTASFIGTGPQPGPQTADI